MQLGLKKVLPDFIRNIRSKLDLAVKKNIYRNLVFKGGGVRGIAYVGALEVLDELGVVDPIQRVAGTSAGAFAATLVSFRKSIPETKAILDTLDVKRIPQKRTKSRKLKFWETIDDESYLRFFNRYGWYSSQYFYDWIQDVIADQCDGNRRATFSEFRDRGFRDLYIVASNISRQRAEFFSADRSPNVAVADAVRMSVSIPIFFEALRFDGERFGAGDYYVDGGLFDNFPMHIFDAPRFKQNNLVYSDGINWETLGLFLFPEEIKTLEDPRHPENVWNFLTLTLRNLYNAHQVSNYRTNPVDVYRTIEISDCGISAVEFDLAPGSEKYNTLYHSGRKAVREFFEL